MLIPLKNLCFLSGMSIRRTFPDGLSQHLLPADDVDTLRERRAADALAAEVVDGRTVDVGFCFDAVDGGSRTVRLVLRDGDIAGHIAILVDDGTAVDLSARRLYDEAGVHRDAAEEVDNTLFCRADPHIGTG